MTMKLTHLLSVLVIGAASPALAQMSLTLSSEEPSSGALSMSAPPNFSMSLETSESSSEEMSTPPDLSLSAPEESSSEELSHMSEPPNFASSSEEPPISEEPLPSEEPSEEPPPAGPPVASADALKLFFDACTDISGGDPAAYDRANDGGWTPNDSED